MSERRCEWCVHYARGGGVVVGRQWRHNWTCLADGPLEPCELYEREPGADDDLESARARLKPYLKPGASEGIEEARARLKQREREIRESME
jgi:hypothetical protein